MRAELREKVLTKFEAQLARLAACFLGESQARQWARTRFELSGQRKMLDAKLRGMPDKKYESMMSSLEVLDPKDLGQLLKKALPRLPKNKGGRDAMFPLEVRRKAILDIGIEYARRDSLRDAVDAVAARYKMPPDYLRRVWKNRKRLREREKEQENKK